MSARLDQGRKRKAAAMESQNEPIPRNPPPDGTCPLTYFIEQYYAKHQQRASDYAKKNEIRDWIEESTAKAGCDYTCYIVGSTSNGFGTAQSDVDICLVIDHQRESVSKSECMKALKYTRRALQNNGFNNHIELIPAKVPILRFHTHNVQIDINCNNLTGLRNTWLLNAYSAGSAKLRDLRVKQLAMFVKKIAKKMDINDPMNGTLSSYSINLMLIHYLQTLKTPILPSIQQLEKDITIDVSLKALPQLIRCLPQWTGLNTDSLADLAVGFFEYYDSFDYEQVISSRLGNATAVDDNDLLKPNHLSFTEKSIRVEEPFDGTNTARACWKVDSFAKVKYAVTKSLKILRRCQESDANIHQLWSKDLCVDEEELNRFVDDCDEPRRRRGYNLGSKKSQKAKEETEYEVIDQLGAARPISPICISSDEFDSGDDLRSESPIHSNGAQEPPREQRLKAGRYFDQDATTSKNATKPSKSAEDDSIPLPPAVLISEECSTVDEGIGSSDKNIIDLTGDNNDESDTGESDTEELSKTALLDQQKKMLLKRLLVQKMAQQDSSEESSDESAVESSADDDEDDNDGESVIKRPSQISKVLKRRNKDIEDITEELPSVIPFPQPKDTITQDETYKQLLDSDEEDTRSPEATSTVEIPSKRIKLPPPRPNVS